jgi:hypothetical protein
LTGGGVLIPFWEQPKWPAGLFDLPERDTYTGQPLYEDIGL